MEIYGVIMAGGGGTRFWPLSRQAKPKQLLNLSGNEVMVNETIDRLAQVAPKDNIYIVTNKTQALAMEEVTAGRIKKENILSEPAARNTAACIGYAAMEIVKKHEDGVMVITPSDAFIKDSQEFARILNLAVNEACSEDCLVTVGITPTFPATGYGYIKYNTEGEGFAKVVEEFKEKPDYETAKMYFESGKYAWNSGMFIWKASVILEKFKELLPEVYEDIVRIGEAMLTANEKDVLEKVYPQIKSISIDYGIMEKAKGVKVIPGEFGWNDVGSFDMLKVMHKEDELSNVSVGNCINIDTVNSVTYSSTGKLIATLGLDNIVVVETADAIMVCNKDKVQDVKKIVDKLKEDGRNEYL